MIKPATSITAMSNRRFALFQRYTIRSGSLDGSVPLISGWRKMGTETFPTRRDARFFFLVGMKEIPADRTPSEHTDRYFRPIGKMCGVKVDYAA